MNRFTPNHRGQGISIARDLLSHSLSSRLIAIHSFDPTLQPHSPKRHPHTSPVNMDSLPRDVRGVVAQQEGNDGCYLLRRRTAFHDAARVGRLLQLLLPRGGVGRPPKVHLRDNPARRNRVDANPVADKLLRHGLRDGHQASFYSVVDPHAGPAEKTGFR